VTGRPATPCRMACVQVSASRRSAYCSTTRKLETGSARAPGGEQADLFAVEVLVGDQGDVAVLHARGQAGPLVLGEEAEVGLEDLSQIVQGAGGGGDEAVQAGAPQEQGEPAQATGTAEEEDEVQGQDEPA